LQADRPELEMHQVRDVNAFPSQTTQVPEFVLDFGGRPRLWFRWYKLTADLGPTEWVQAFAERNPPPVAVIGGGSSDRARDLARSLKEQQPRFRPSAPLLLITTATADLVDDDQELIAIYQQSFRFCFTNSQMAEAVADFIWMQEDLRPDGAPLYMALWDDDPYSEDLFKQFHRVLGPDGFYRSFRPEETLQSIAKDWAWLAGRLSTGGIPTGMEMEGLRRGEYQSRPVSGQFVHIPYSVGTYTQPNRWEVGASEIILNQLTQHPDQRRPLLVLPAGPQPARRLLRALLRAAPQDASRFIVATGDAIDFNTIYRDRNLAWPIQDLPIPLVLFCHRNPVDPRGFEPLEGNEPPDARQRTSTGTQDLLLYRDILETLAKAVYDGKGTAQDSSDLGDKLRHQPRPTETTSRFDHKGNLESGSGEFVVCLRPVRAADRVLPQARLQVWNRLTNADGARHWQQVPVAGQPELLVGYSSASEN